MSKHDKDESTKHESTKQHESTKHESAKHPSGKNDPQSTQQGHPVIPGSKEDKDNLHHEHEKTRTEHEHTNAGPAADERTDGQRQRDEQLQTGGRPYTDQPHVAAGGLTDEQRKNVKVNTPPDSPLVVPTNNADPPVATTPWNPPQGDAAPLQNKSIQETAEQYRRPEEEAKERIEKDDETAPAQKKHI